MLSESFASVLRSGRDHFNAEFKSARHKHPELDGDAFSSFLATSVDPLIQAVARCRPERVADTALAAYEVALELVGLRLSGPRARTPLLDHGWRRVLPAAAALVAESPLRLLSALSNALHQLAAWPDANHEAWISSMAALAPHAPNGDVLLGLGQLCAWRAGLAHYRNGALAVADSLPAELVLAALGAAAGSDWARVRQGLHESPWFDPSAATSGVRCVGAVGGFRGFGGPFAVPPRVVCAGEHFFVLSGDDTWLLSADVFGATLHRARSDELDGARPRGELPPGATTGEGHVEVDGRKVPIPLNGKPTSAAFGASTLALTGQLTHAVVLVAWERS